MLGLFRRDKPARSSLPSVPDGTRVYAIGDIHGCLDALDRLLDSIATDARTCGGDVHLVFLGDLVDRGPDSAGVVERILRGPLPGRHRHVMMGNHEEAMLGVYDGTGDVRGWLRYGGIETLESYGIARAEHFARGFDLSQRMQQAIPSDHITFLRSLPDTLKLGDYLFVHAGIRPGVALDQQQPQDLRWIRSDFLASEADHGMIVVHGHTIADVPESFANRIGIDTGCYASGALTALMLEGTEQRFLQVACGPD